MRTELIQKMKQEIEARIKEFLRGEGLELHIAANDNLQRNNPLVKLEEIDDIVLSGTKLLFEIRVVMGLLGKAWKCESLVKGIYYALHPHSITLSELTVLLMSVHTEQLRCPIAGFSHNRAVMRYIVEEV